MSPFWLRAIEWLLWPTAVVALLGLLMFASMAFDTVAHVCRRSPLHFFVLRAFRLLTGLLTLIVSSCLRS
jgi:hypothetical protein